MHDRRVEPDASLHELRRGQTAAKPLRAGIIGLDTSHVTAFTQLLNSLHPRAELAGVRVVAGYPGGSPDVAASRNRVAGFTRELHDKYGVEIVASIDELLKKVDVVLLESVDGRPHLAAGPSGLSGTQAGLHRQARSGYARRCDRDLRPGPGIRHSLLFELLAAVQSWSRGDEEQPQAGQRYRLRCLRPLPSRGASSRPLLVWSPRGRNRSSLSWAPAVSRSHACRPRERTWPWASGTEVESAHSADCQGAAEYGATVFGSRVSSTAAAVGYEPLLVEVCEFFLTGKPPVSAEQTIEIFAFMEAADESKRRGASRSRSRP